MNPNPFLGMSRTSLQGWLNLAIVVLLQLAAIQLPATLATPGASHILLWITFGATTLAGILSAIVHQGAGDAPANPPSSSSSTLVKVLVLAMLLGSACTLKAQTINPLPNAPTPQTGITITTSGDVLAISGGGGWTVGARTTENVKFTTNISLESQQVLDPAANLSAYYGDINYNLPIDSVLGNTLIAPDTIQASINGGAGVVHNAAVITPTTSLGLMVGGNLKYSPAGNGVFSVTLLSFEYYYTPGAVVPSSFGVGGGVAASFGAGATTSGVTANIAAHKLRANKVTLARQAKILKKQGIILH